MLTTPASTPNENSIDIQSRLVEVSEALWKQLGWEELRSNPAQEIQGLLGAAQTAQFLKSLQETVGVEVLSAPRITTANGREAHMISGDSENPASLRIGVIPSTTADGASFDLRLSVQLPHPVPNSTGIEPGKPPAER